MKTTSVVLIVLVIGLVVVAAFSISDKPSFFRESFNHPILVRIRDNFQIMDPQFYRIPLYKGNSSYTEDKKAITLCLEDPKTGESYSMNTMMYVALHELAHVITKSYEDHGDEYKRNFRMLLARAESLGIYDPSLPIPRNYCGVSE